MGNIQTALKLVGGADEQIGKALIEFYAFMKELESDSERLGKQAVLIVMTIADFKEIFIENLKLHEND